VTEPNLRVLLVDDHPVYRDGLARLLTDLGGFEIVGVASNGREAVERSRSLSPDVIVMDLRMPILDGVEATRQITAADPEIGIVVLTMFDDDELVFAAIRAGARGYLMKDADDVDIARVLHGIARGEAIFGPGTAQRLLDTINRTGAPQPSAERAFPHLTTRELEVLEHLARGRRNGEIAAELFLSERTVRNYVSNVLTKLDVDDRARAITMARDAGLGQPPRSSDAPKGQHRAERSSVDGHLEERGRDDRPF
jgi:DNA-binding NarL/FixJ family response regulator